MGEPEIIRGEVIKASPAIQIQNNITLLQRKAWNVLLFHAYDRLLSESRHELSVKRLKEFLGYNSKDDEYLKEIIRAMMTCIVEWNLLGKDGENRWGASTLLSAALIEGGICEYEYSSILKERLYNPKMYARISLSLQNNFKSKHAQALWELCLDYLGASRAYGTTPYIELEMFKKLMGVGENAYPSYKRLSEKVLRPALAEINRVSDLQVTVEYQQKGRKVIGLKFKIRRVTALPAADGQQRSLFPDLEDMPEVVKRLKEAGMAESDAWEFWQKGWEFVSEKKRPAGDVDLLDYVREKIDLLRQRQQEWQVQNPSGFLLTALKQNFSHAEYEQKRAAEKRAEKLKQLRQLVKERERLEKMQDKDLETLCDKVIELPGQVEKAIKALGGADDFARWYDKDRSALDNYRKNRPIRSLMAEWLEGQFPEQFEAVLSLPGKNSGD